MRGKTWEKLKKTLGKILNAFLQQFFVFSLIGLLLVLFFLGGLSGYSYFKKIQSSQLPSLPQATEQKTDAYIEFLSEVYDKIKENYWDNISDAQLSNLFKAGSERLIATQHVLKSADREGLRQMVAEINKDLNEAQKKEFAAKLVSLVVSNLNPLGRNGLYTIKDEESLKNTVLNINPERNLYDSLGVSKEATAPEIKESFEKKVAELEAKKDQSPEIKKQLQELKYAYEVLTDQAKKQTYDSSGAEPTVFTRLVRPEILHLYIKKFSPTTFDEFVRAVADADKGEQLNSLILDLRGNIGGSIDILPYFLGPFIGQEHYAYDLFHKGEYTPYKTKIGWLPGLVRYKRVVILIDEQTQSTAEVMAATLKKYNVGVLVGVKSRGWGTVEKVFEIGHQIDEKEKYSIFLVHSLTLRDDNQPIEGIGVEPVIYMADPNWQKQLFSYFNDQSLVEAVKEIWSKNPVDIK